MFQGLRLKAGLVAGVLLAFGATPALTYDWMATGNIATIESTYMPGRIVFQMTVSGGSCTSGAWLTWYAKGVDAAEKQANVQAVLAVLMSAKLSGQQIRIYGNNTGCTVDYMHLP